MHARLAAALDPRVANVEWQEGFRFSDSCAPEATKHRDIKSIILPGVLRYFDVDEL